MNPDTRSNRVGWRLRRPWIVGLALVLTVTSAAVLLLPEMARRLAVTRIQALTNRPVQIDDVDLNLFSGWIVVRGFRLADRHGEAALASFDRLAVRLHLPSLMRGHIRVREGVLRHPTVRVVRLPGNQFNISDLVQRSGDTGTPLDVTIDHFVLENGTTSLEDRALAEPRTWTSERIAIEVHNVSTRRDDGTAVATSITAGAPVAIEVRDMRLYPIHLRARVTAEGVDLGLARLYFPPEAPVAIDRGRASTSASIRFDARGGLELEGTGRLADVHLIRSGTGEAVARVPDLAVRILGLGVVEGALRLARLEVEGSAALDPRVRPTSGLDRTSLRASVTDLTWPVVRPARVEMAVSAPRHGNAVVDGQVQPAPAPSDLRLRLSAFDLAPWTRLLPVPAHITGVAEADLRVNEPLAAEMPTRVRGSLSVRRPGIAGPGQTRLTAERITASGLEVRWPAAVRIGHVLVDRPRAVVERDRAGGFPVRDLWTRRGPLAAGEAFARPASPAAAARDKAAPAVTLEVGTIALRGGDLAWRDEALPKPVRLRVSGIEADVSGMAWPLRGPLAVRLGVVPPGGGRLEVRGRVAADPLGADLRVVASNTEVAAYRPYLPIAADVSGRADAALAVTVPPTGVEGTTVRGQAGLSGLDVRDGKRTVLRVERALAEGVDVAWPRRIAAAVLHLERPWLLVERDERGALPLRKLFTAVPNSTSSQGTRASRSGPPSMPAGEAAQDRLAGRPEEGPPLAGGGGPLALAVERVRVAGGGVRVVDRGASGAFAVDLRDLLLRADGFSTAPAPPARIELTGRFARGAELVARGSIGALGAPLHVDATAELKSFEIPLVNPYLSQQVAWRAERGSLTTSVRARVRGDALDARTEVLLSHLLVVRSGPEDMARGRFGLPLGLIISLMKDQQGDIRLVFPIGGRLQDPRFDVSEAIWSAIRTVAIKLITLPISSIGRVRVGRDSRIESIELEPIRFEPAVDRLTPEGRAQLARVADFLRQTPDVRMALTPVSARSDLLELRRRRATEAIERVERRSRLPREVAAARLFAERFPERALPRTPDALVSALAVSEPEPTAELEVLATARMRAVRAALDRARIDGDRLLAGRAREEPPDAGPAAVPGVELQMVEPDTAPRPGILERIRRLGPTTGRE